MAFITLGTVAPGDVLRANSGTAAYNNVIGNVQDIRAAQINVQSTVKTDTFSSSSGSFTDVTGLSVSITPSSATSKVLVIATVNVGVKANEGYLNLVRGSTNVLIGDAASSRPRITAAVLEGADFGMQAVTITYLDSPNTINATTYKIQARSNAGATLYVNRSDGDRNTSAFDGRGASVITVMEVAA